MKAITYRSELVAITTSTRVFLSPEIATRTRGDPVQRFVLAMCLCALDAEAEDPPVPFGEQQAELYARCLLVPDDEFAALARRPDRELADRFRVPAEQIALKRADISRRPDVA